MFLLPLAMTHTYINLPEFAEKSADKLALYQATFVAGLIFCALIQNKS